MRVNARRHRSNIRILRAIKCKEHTRESRHKRTTQFCEAAARDKPSVWKFVSFTERSEKSETSTHERRQRADDVWRRERKRFDDVFYNFIKFLFRRDLARRRLTREKGFVWETSLRTITSAPMKATEKDEPLQERFKFIVCNEDDWITMKEYFFNSSLFSSMKLTTEKHARKKQYLFDMTLWLLHLSKCFEAAMINDTHVVLLFSAGRICISQQLVASASQLSDNIRSFNDNIRKRVVNADIFTKDQIRKKQIL